MAIISQMTIAEGFLASFDPEMRNTRRMLERVPDDAMEYKPHQKSMPLGRLAGHIAEMIEWGKTTVEVDEMDFRPPGAPEYVPYVPANREAVLEHFDRAVANTREAVAKTTDDAMRRDWTLLMSGNEIFKMPRIAVLQTMVLSHVIHHRAQLGVYLRMNDVPIPGMYGPSADER